MAGMGMKTAAWIGMLGLCVGSARADEPQIDRKPLSIGALYEFGQLGRGIYGTGLAQNATLATGDWLDHFGAFINEQAVVDGRLLLSGGIGGVFQFRKPEVEDAGFDGSERKEFFVGPTQAEAVYSLGDVSKPWLKLGTGMFWYKYNSDAADLGEYLFRSGAYPEYTVTGGYVLVASASAALEGFKSSLDLGAFKADFLLTTETNLAPLYDWSPAVVLSYSVADGLLDLGAGANFKRMISVRPSRTSPHSVANGYFVSGGKSYTTNLSYYDQEISFYHTKGDPTDSALVQAQEDTINRVLAMPDSLPGKPAIGHYTAAGTLLMARASLDFKKIFNSGMFGPQDLKLYSEIALLGVKDYPFFYERMKDRIPVMAGFNLPGFRFLDLCALQVEYFHSPWLNNTSQIGNFAIDVPHFPTASDNLLSQNSYNDLARKDDLKWSLLIQKKIGTNITISGQAANDHLRLVSSSYYYGPQFDHNEVTVSKKDWYWMTQVSWGL